MRGNYENSPPQKNKENNLIDNFGFIIEKKLEQQKFT